MVDTTVAPVRIVVVYHSGFGHTARIAEAVARGAAEISGASVRLFTAEEAPGQWGILDGADAIIMGAPLHGQPVGSLQSVHGRDFALSIR
jgi:flavodoxin